MSCVNLVGWFTVFGGRPDLHWGRGSGGVVLVEGGGQLAELAAAAGGVINQTLTSGAGIYCAIDP